MYSVETITPVLKLPNTVFGKGEKLSYPFIQHETYIRKDNAYIGSVVVQQDFLRGILVVLIGGNEEFMKDQFISFSDDEDLMPRYEYELLKNPDNHSFLSLDPVECHKIKQYEGLYIEPLITVNDSLTITLICKVHSD
jgi:hypothetical protein